MPGLTKPEAAALAGWACTHAESAALLSVQKVVLSRSVCRAAVCMALMATTSPGRTLKPTP